MPFALLCPEDELQEFFYFFFYLYTRLLFGKPLRKGALPGAPLGLFHTGKDFAVLISLPSFAQRMLVLAPSPRAARAVCWPCCLWPGAPMIPVTPVTPVMPPCPAEAAPLGAGFMLQLRWDKLLGWGVCMAPAICSI